MAKGWGKVHVCVCGGKKAAQGVGAQKGARRKEGPKQAGWEGGVGIKKGVWGGVCPVLPPSSRPCQSKSWL